MGEYWLNKSNMKFMIMDACVLIDYMNSEPELFNLIKTYVGPIHVITPIIEEVDSINSFTDLEDLGLILIEPEIEDVFTAGEIDGPTSFQDNLCYLTAKRNELICVSNDKNLRKNCLNENVALLWGLELILELVKAKGISTDDAGHIADKIHRSNPRHINLKILSAFRKKLKDLKQVK